MCDIVFSRSNIHKPTKHDDDGDDIEYVKETTKSSRSGSDAILAPRDYPGTTQGLFSMVVY